MKFTVSHVAQIDVEIDDVVIAEVTSEDWRKDFYNLQTPEDVAEHLAYNYVANAVDDVTRLDGFAHLRKDQVKFSKPKYDLDESVRKT